MYEFESIFLNHAVILYNIYRDMKFRKHKCEGTNFLFIIRLCVLTLSCDVNTLLKDTDISVRIVDPNAKWQLIKNLFFVAFKKGC